MRRAAYRSLLLLPLLAAGPAWVRMDKTVTVEVDGQPRAVRTHAGTVGGVLDRIGLTVGEHDVVAPQPSVKIREGARIVLRRGREVEVLLNGKRRKVWVTALSVDEAMAQLGLRSSANAFVSASRSRSIPLGGLSFEVRTPARIRILADGAEKALTTTAPTVKAALAEAKVPFVHTDLVTPGLGAYPAEGTVVQVTRVRGGQARETLSIPYETVRQDDATLYKGSTKVVTPGRTGLREKVYALTTTNGRVTRRQLIVDRIARQPRTRVMRVGTKPRPFYMTRDTSSVDHLNWLALARCESGNNPNSVGGGGRYFGLYQFTLGTWRGVGGTGNPTDASRDEQTYRAKLLYMRRGTSPWPACGRRLFS